MIRLVLCAALVLAGGCAAPAPAPALAPFPDAAAAKTDPALVALYDAYRRGADLDAAAPGLMVTADGVQIEATAADGDGEGLAIALGRIGLEDASAYGVAVNGRLPIASLPAAGGLASLRYLSPVIPPDRTPPTPPDRI